MAECLRHVETLQDFLIGFWCRLLSYSLSGKSTQSVILALSHALFLFFSPRQPKIFLNPTLFFIRLQENEFSERAAYIPFRIPSS